MKNTKLCPACKSKEYASDLNTNNIGRCLECSCMWNLHNDVIIINPKKNRNITNTLNRKHVHT